MQTIKICYPFKGKITATQLVAKYYDAIANEDLTEPSEEFAPQSAMEMLEALEWLGIVTRDFSDGDPRSD